MAATASASQPQVQDDLFEEAQEELDPSLTELLDATSLQWIFVGGKGGVGKTTTACALALELASRRESVLLISTDPAHNISDALCQKFFGTPSLVHGFDNFYAMEIEASLNENIEFKLKQDDGFANMMQEMVSAFPGVDEAMGFAELMQNVKSMPYSVIVFDTAPTGHTLRLLGFPDLLDRGLGKLGSAQNKFGGLMQVMQSLADQPSQEEDMAQRVTNLRSASSSVKEIFQDPTKCTFVCVCIPEFLSVYETERLVQELCKHGIDASNLVVNQVLFPDDCGAALGSTAPPPTEAGGDEQLIGGDELEALAAQLTALDLPRDQTDPLADVALRAARRVRDLEKGWDMCQKKRRVQAKYLAQISDLYRDDFHVVAVPMLGDEVRGVDRLRAFATLLRNAGGRSLPLA